MATKVLVPLLGEGVEEVTVTKWLKKEGDSVNELEPLLEVNTDKVDTEIPAPATLNVQCLSSSSCLSGIAKGAGVDAVMVGSVGPGPQGLQFAHRLLAAADPQEGQAQVVVGLQERRVGADGQLEQLQRPLGPPGGEVMVTPGASSSRRV